MTKLRIAIPRATAREVLAEFHHRCAICGADGPQLHHIDQDPAHNDPSNLIPLCPNCHLRDQHDPTRAIDPGKLRLFRTYRDPFILLPQFHPLFTRLRFLVDVRPDTPIAELDARVAELVEFVAALEMGAFYSKRMAGLLQRPRYLHFATAGPARAGTRESSERQEHAEYRSRLWQVRVQVCDLVVELLRYQPWGER